MKPIRKATAADMYRGEREAVAAVATEVFESVCSMSNELRPHVKDDASTSFLVNFHGTDYRVTVEKAAFGLDD